MRKAHDAVVTIQGHHRGESSKAIRFEVHNVAGEDMDVPRSEWFPFSQVEKIVRQPAGSSNLDELVVSQWILEQKELI